MRSLVSDHPANRFSTGDEIAHTVYFLSNGATPVFGTNLCDQIPTGTGFLADTAEIQRGQNYLTLCLMALVDSISCTLFRLGSGRSHRLAAQRRY